MSTEPSPRVDVETVKQRLRDVEYPGFSGNIVSHGFVRGIALGDDGVLVVRFAPDTRRDDKVSAMSAAIKSALDGLPGVREVRIERSLPFAEEPSAARPQPLTPLQAELLEAGIQPDADVMSVSLGRADVALEAGYGPNGPAEMDAPLVDLHADAGARAVAIPVFQWEVDPNDPSRATGEDEVVMDDWEYRVWWQLHPQGLAYASIHAVRDDAHEDRPSARPHPVGRNVVVNLVYDIERDGVVAIYGTAGDFRPFVEAFRRAYRL